MTEQEVRTMVVNRVDDFLENLFDKHIKDRVRQKIEAAFKDDDLRMFLHRKSEKAVEAMCDQNTRPELLRIIRRWARPQIIYTNEARKTPPQLAPLGAKEVFLCPVTPCVYFLCKEDRIVYIGQSVNLQARLGQHLLLKNFDRVYYMEVREDELNRIEAELIEYYDPELNKTGNMNETKTNNERQRR